MLSRRGLPVVILLTAAIVAVAASAETVSLIDTCPRESSIEMQAPSLTYDVASIRPHSADDGRVSFRDPAHEASITMTGVSLRNLIEMAYAIADYQLSGGPGNLLLQRYDIRATSDSAATDLLQKLTDCQAGLVKRRMLQAVLAERTQLIVHRVSKEASGYSLVVAKGGAKLRETKLNPPSDAIAPALGGRMTMRLSKGGFDVTAQDYSLKLLTSWLASELHVPVVDKTGLTAEYDFDVEYARNDMRDAGSASADSYPSLFTALQEQLGLKLEPGKTSMELIVVEHVEAPTQN